MRCTKCHYLSFEPEARCRNCGHDLSIDDLAGRDLPLTANDFSNDPGDVFDLADTDIAGLGTSTAVMAPPARAAAAVALAPTPALVTSPVTSELPLFVRDLAGDEDDEPEHEPMIRVPSRPRAPIAVRRTTPDPARLRAKYATPEVPDSDFHDLLDEPAYRPQAAPAEAISDVEPVPPRLPAGWRAPVDAGTRLAAAGIDAALLGTIAVIVTSFTLRFSGASLSNFGLVAALPLAAFVVLIAAGYELMFTAAQGQTIGKMLMGIRVVGTGVSDSRVTISQAAVRAVAAVPSVLALGAGFVPALVGSGLAVHDRVAHTRVVRV